MNAGFADTWEPLQPTEETRRMVASMHKGAFLVLGAGLAPTALGMLWAPLLWYEWFPGVAERGAFNAHFVRDLGCCFLVVALSFLWAVKAEARARSAVIASTGFLLLHALVHAAEATAGAHHVTGRLLTADFALVYAPTALAAWAAARLGPEAHRSVAG
jgi:hypothetical protein